MKAIATIALAAGLAGALPAHAADIAALYGTWECRMPGSATTKTPPIVWLAPASGAEAGKLIVEVDGFSRDIAGIADVTPAAGGWWKATPATGTPFLMREAVAPRGRRAPSMELRRTETAPAYRCLRLPNRDELRPAPNKG